MDILWVTPSSYRSLAARVVAATIAGFLIVSGLAVPAKANVTPSLASADVVATQNGFALDLILGTPKNVTITSNDPGAPLVDGNTVSLVINDETVANSSTVSPVAVSAGGASFAFSGLKAGNTTLTFDYSSPELADLVVDVNVIDPALKSTGFAFAQGDYSLGLVTGAAAKVATIFSDLEIGRAHV